jgi:hypothetical protein
VGHQLICYLDRKFTSKAPLDVESRQLIPLGHWRGREFATLTGEICLL